MVRNGIEYPPTNSVPEYLKGAFGRLLIRVSGSLRDFVKEERRRQGAKDG